IERKAGKKAVEIQLEGYADKDVLKQELVFDDVIVETLEKTMKKPLSKKYQLNSQSKFHL
ncbi:hypothetical protein HK221_00020, partial [Streptococcus agalactiae]|nr:hypothetical protein [Streptococcus agalactiae]